MRLGFHWPSRRSEETKKKIIAKNRPRRVKFEPDREYCKSAVEEYLKNGGKIKLTVVSEEVTDERSCEADDFLMGKT